jgi:23S rRNA pseudouridine1911/1915/1917 synthase
VIESDSAIDLENDEEELYEHHRFVVDPGQAVLRIDKFLIDRLAKTSRNRVQVAARNGNVLVNTKAVKPNYRIKPGDEISIVMPYPIREIELIPQAMPLDIVYEDSELLVVNKPVNLVVHPGYGNYSGTLVNGLLYHFSTLPSLPHNYYGRPGLVHRIDKNTSGLLVVAKTEDALTHLAKQFYDKTTERVYHALVWGDIKEPMTIRKNVGRSPKNRKVMTTFSDEQEGKVAITHLRPLQRFGAVSLIECRLETGRTHQIRVHLQSIGHPLFNDPEYGGNTIRNGSKTKAHQSFVDKGFNLLPGQALHAKTLGFVHPSTQAKLTFNSEVNAGFQQLLDHWSSCAFDY